MRVEKNRTAAANMTLKVVEDVRSEMKRGNDLFERVSRRQELSA